jgi:AcrR family transcriptional regulator
MTQPNLETPARTRLLEAAIICFAEKGFDATGIREIALKAKANSALVQYYFGGKTGLYAAALGHIFSCHPLHIPARPEGIEPPNARTDAIHSLGAMVETLLEELLACRDGSELDRAAHFLVTREMNSPRVDVATLIVDHMRPYTDLMQACLKVLRPDLDWLQAMDYTHSIFAQVVHLHHNLPLIRMLRNEPDYPQDLKAVARHITEFSLRGIGIPEAFPGA